MDIAADYAATATAMTQDAMALMMVRQQATEGQVMANMLQQAADTTQTLLSDPGPGVGGVVDQFA